MNDSVTPERKIIWAPQPGPQEALVNCPIAEILIGGARGGGKTQGELGFYLIKEAKWGQKFNGIIFRQEMPQTDDLIQEAKDIYERAGAHWAEQKKLFQMPNGGLLRFRPLENESDALKYKGQNLCVSVGTPIRLANGSLKPIEQIVVGDLVATLEGPKPVTYITTPYLAPCVECRVLAPSGDEVSLQRHPVWHPVLTPCGIFSSAELTSERTFPTLDNEHQFPPKTPADDTSREGFFLHKDLMSLAWRAFSEDVQNFYTASPDCNLEKPQSPPWSVPVVLHAPSLRSLGHVLQNAPVEASGCRFPDKLEKLSFDSSLELHAKSKDLELPCAPSLQVPVLSVLAFCEEAYAQTKSQIALNSQSDYPSYRDSYDEHSPLAQESDLDSTPLQGGAVESSQTALLDESGTTQKHSHEGSRWWVHPYTGEARHLLEDVVYGRMEVRYIGESLVTDLTVQDANHYITESGLINKNSDVNVQESDSYPDPAPIDKLWGALRSKHGVPCQMLLDANPGGLGHTWLYERFIEPAPQGYTIIKVKLPDGKIHERVFIPALLKHNKLLLENDPDYASRLYLVGSEQLVKAWLDGDWNVKIEGAFFPEFDDKLHVISPPRDITPWPPTHWARAGGYDWGIHSDFCCLWGAISSGKDDNGREVPYPKGSLVIYKELHGRGVSNVDQANAILAHPDSKNMSFYADPSIWAMKGGPSIASEFTDAGLPFLRADNHRISGASQVRARLSRRAIYICYTCPYLIQQIKFLPTDKKNPADCDTKAPDHAYDALRYLCKARVLESDWIDPNPRPLHYDKRPKTWGEYIKAKRQQASQQQIKY